MAEEKRRRQRRSFTEEFKAQVVKKVLSSGKTAGQVARELDLTETAVRNWGEAGARGPGKGPPGALTTAEKEELARLRKENRELREDREILCRVALEALAELGLERHTARPGADLLTSVP